MTNKLISETYQIYNLMVIPFEVAYLLNLDLCPLGELCSDDKTSTIKVSSN